MIGELTVGLCDQGHRPFHVIHNPLGLTYIIKLISFPAGYTFVPSINELLTLKKNSHGKDHFSRNHRVDQFYAERQLSASQTS